MKSQGKMIKARRAAQRVADFLPTAHLAALGGAGAVMALAPGAAAAPIQSPAVNISIPVTTAGIYVNVVSGVTNTTPASVPGWDLNGWGSSSLRVWANNSTEASDGVMRFPGDAASNVGNLTPGTMVDASRTYGRTPSTVFGAGTGEWKTDATNYVGFRFQDGGELYYGWASVIVGATSTDASRKFGEIWYESLPNTGIEVGATSATNPVPEPSSALLLAAGAAGLLALRRRRQVR